MNKITVIYCSEGNAHLEVMDRDVFLNCLGAGDWSKREFYRPGSPDDLSCFEGLIVCEGEPVQPIAKEVATVYEWPRR